MSNPKYTMVTVAACESAYVQEALKHVSGFVADLISKAGAVSARVAISGPRWEPPIPICTTVLMTFPE